METKQFKGKAIYNPSGKAGEYSYWACNFYTGCSNNCDYCYCKRGVLSSTWSTEPKLKSCFKDKKHALQVFEKELKQNIIELQHYGLFFSFTTDPMLVETREMTYNAMVLCLANSVPIKILTKCADFVKEIKDNTFEFTRKNIAIGFTLTGHDEIEAKAATNQQRIIAMKQLYMAGFKTFASIEPIIDFESSIKVIRQTVAFCDLYKIGFLSGKKYDRQETVSFMAMVHQSGCKKIYWKDSVTQFVQRANHYPLNCVGRYYNLFSE